MGTHPPPSRPGDAGRRVAPAARRPAATRSRNSSAARRSRAAAGVAARAMGFSSEGRCVRREGGLEDWRSGFCGSPSRAKPFYPDRTGAGSPGPGKRPDARAVPGPEGGRGPAGLPRNPRLRGGGGVSSLRRNPRKGSESPPRRGYRLRGRPWAPRHPLVSGRRAGKALGADYATPSQGWRDSFRETSVSLVIRPGRIKEE